MIHVLAALLLLATPSPGVETTTIPSLVRVESFTKAAGDESPVGSALGFIVEDNGFLLTTYEHLVNDSGEVLPRIRATVIRDDREAHYPARVIGVEPTLNFAVLKIESDDTFLPSEISRTQAVESGQGVYAVSSLTEPAKHRVLGRLVALNSIECYQESLTQTMFSAEMIIPESGIGSPVFNDTGQVVALYTGYEPPHNPDDEEYEDPEDELHMLPIFLAFNVYESIKHRQSLASPWTGFSVRPLTGDEQSRFPVADGRFRSGIAFDYIWDNSPASKMGLEKGDILVRFGHHPIHSPADFQKWLYMYGVGREVEIYVLRDGAVTVFDYTIEERPDWAVPR